jgi:hypothetical protein
MPVAGVFITLFAIIYIANKVPLMHFHLKV